MSIADCPSLEAQIDLWRSLPQLSRREVEEQLGMEPDEVVHTAYAWEQGVDLLRNRAAHPGQFYFRGDTFVVYTITSLSELRDISGTQLIQTLGEPAESLPSRVGKRFKVHIYPEKGIAVSAEGDTIRLIEIFPPLSLAEYRASFYMEPEAFTR